MATTLKFGNGEWYGKKDTILAYNDENNNYKPLPFDFSRGSSATVVNKDGLIETVGSGQPRIDFSDSSEGAMLLEPQRKNDIIYSEALSNTLVKSGTYTDNFAISPDGTQNATKLTATNADPYFYQDLTFLSSSYTVSIYLKGIGSSIGKNFQIRLAGNIYTDVIPSDWTRFEYTQTISSGAASVGLEIPNPAVTGDEVLVWGWQLEQGSYATSYIPTSGSAVTRLADFAEQDLPNDNILIDNNSTIYFEVDTTDLINNTPNTGGFNFKNSGGAAVLNFNYGYGRIYSNYYTGSTTAIISSAEVGRYKIAFPLTNGSYLYVNGVQKSATSRDWSSISISEIEILFGHSIIDFKLYNTILSNSELQALTSN